MTTVPHSAPLDFSTLFVWTTAARVPAPLNNIPPLDSYNRIRSRHTNASLNLFLQKELYTRFLASILGTLTQSARKAPKMKGIKRYLSKPEHLVLGLAGVASLVTISLLVLAIVTGDRGYGLYAQRAFFFALIVAVLPFAAFLFTVILETLTKLIKRILLVVVSIGVSGYWH
ncbi:MAG: hypothetical protein R3268_09510 [Acidiferrobacterales bacterium]|nr:hypothetical protein [Acidiferrobacterales bacterium]